MYEIAKTFTFSASHRLEGLPDGHKCQRLHGHNYTVQIRLSADDLDDQGFVADFAELDRAARWLRENFDHRHLNEVMDGPPTSERIAAMVFKQCAASFLGRSRVHLSAVRVAETASTWAEYRPAVTAPKTEPGR